MTMSVLQDLAILPLCDFFLMEFMKFKVYANKPRSILQHKDEIERVIGDIGPQMFDKVISTIDSA